jgi:hypothetical protein
MRLWAIATCVSFGFIAASSANPLDSPGTVYIDGLPCNIACQSYMAWSRQTLRTRRSDFDSAVKLSHGKAAGDAFRKQISKRAVQNPVSRSRAKTDDAQAANAATTTPPSLPMIPQDHRPSPDVHARVPGEPEQAQQVPSKAENAVLVERTGEPPRERSAQEQVMAALTVAEKITNVEAQKSMDQADIDKTDASAGTAQKKSQELVAILIARQDVKTMAELESSNIAIDVGELGYEEDLRSALSAKGATKTQLSVSNANPLDRLIDGDVRAAVIRLVSPSAAGAFPEIKGFKVFVVPLR